MASINSASAFPDNNAKPENWNNNIPVITMGKKNNARSIDYNSLIAAGINPVTGNPTRAGGADGRLKESIKIQLRLMDEQDAVNRYTWYNLPCNLTSQEVERAIYYRGQLAFFYIPDLDEFYFMPYALDGGIDFYGRFKTVHPIPLAEGVSDAEKKQIQQIRNYLSNLKLNVKYDVVDYSTVKSEEEIEKIINNSCVLLHDYTKQLSQTIIPRQQLQEGILDVMADCIPFMKTALLSSTGVQGMRVSSEDEQSNVSAASALINHAALNSEKFVAIIGQLDFQELTAGQVAKAEEFLLAMQGLDNFRLSTYGIDNGGLFEKKAHKLQAEQEMNSGNTGIIYDDGLTIRQHFCDVVNSIWGIGISCEPSESVMGIDKNLDGMVVNSQDQSGMMYGEQPDMPIEGGSNESY